MQCIRSIPTVPLRRTTRTRVRAAVLHLLLLATLATAPAGAEVFNPFLDGVDLLVPPLADAFAAKPAFDDFGRLYVLQVAPTQVRLLRRDQATESGFVLVREVAYLEGTLRGADLTLVEGVPYIAVIFPNLTRVDVHYLRTTSGGVLAWDTEFFDVGSDGIPAEVVMTSKAEASVQDRAYIGIMTEIGRVKVYYKDTVDDFAWTATAGGALNNGAGGLSIDHHEGRSPGAPYLVISYQNVQDFVVVAGVDFADDGWEILDVVPNVPSNVARTSVAAGHDRIAVAYEDREMAETGSLVQVVRVGLSNDAGATWSAKTPFWPYLPQEFFTNFEVGSYGESFLWVAVGGPAGRVRKSFVAVDFAISSEDSMNDHLSFNASPLGLATSDLGRAVTYRSSVDGMFYLDLVPSTRLFRDSFENGDLGAWSAVVSQ